MNSQCPQTRNLEELWLQNRRAIDQADVRLQVGYLVENGGGVDIRDVVGPGAEVRFETFSGVAARAQRRSDLLQVTYGKNRRGQHAPPPHQCPVVVPDFGGSLTEQTDHCDIDL